MRSHVVRNWRAIVIILISAVGAWGTWAWFNRPPRVNVLLITLDTTRADHLGCYGDETALTPVIDALAARGVLFEKAYAPIPLTLPSHASLLTSLYPPEHGLRTNGKHRLPDDLVTLPTLLQQRGYDTGAFVASFVLDSKFGLERGFQTYDDDLTGTAPADEALHRNRDGNVVVDAALNWLGGRTEKPFFCWVHLYDPHTPYEDHRAEFGERFVENPYSGEIAFVDQQIGRLMKLLEQKKIDERTIVVVIGDHGEGLNEHGERRHGQLLYNSTLHVPWIMAWPEKLPAQRSIPTVVSLVDFTPTLLDLLRLPALKELSGRSLMPLVRGDAFPPRGLYAESNEGFFESQWSPLRCLIDENWKYIRTPQVELYDLAHDFGELRNLAADDAERVERMERQLADVEGAMRARTAAPVRLSSSESSKLSGLGYVGHTSEGDEKPLVVDFQQRDMKEMLPFSNALEDARHKLDAGEFADAEAQMREILAAMPEYEYAEISLGDVYLKQEKLDEAWDIYQRIVKRNPDSGLAHTHLGDIREQQGKFQEALGHYERAVDLEPDVPKLHYNLGRLLVILGRDDEALPRFELAIHLDPGYAFARIELGTLLSRRGMFASALEQYESALAYDPQSMHACMNAASVLTQMQRPGDAIRYLERAVKIAPAEFDPRLYLGMLLLELGDRRRAAEHLNEAARLKPDDPRVREFLN